MKSLIDLRVAELLAARLCHDLIGPIAAIGNGAELLSEEEEFAAEAAALIGDSARKANAQLQFYRFAWGFGGGGLAGPPPHVLAADFLSSNSIACDYDETVRALPLEQQKLACAMLAVAAEGLPRGGRLVVSADPHGLAIEAIAEGRGLSPELQAALTLSVDAAELTSRTVGGYFAGLLAGALGWRLVVRNQPQGFRLATAAA
jgi:histidine phosphotransferase ChpT